MSDITKIINGSRENFIPLGSTTCARLMIASKLVAYWRCVNLAFAKMRLYGPKRETQSAIFLSSPRRPLLVESSLAYLMI